MLTLTKTGKEDGGEVERRCASLQINPNQKDVDAAMKRVFLIAAKMKRRGYRTRR